VEGVEVLLVFGNLQANARPGYVFHRSLGVRDADLAGGINPRADSVADAACGDHDRLAGAEGIGNTDDGLQGVALRPARRRAVRRLVADAHAVVEDLAYYFGRYAEAVVGDAEAQHTVFLLDLHPNLRGHARRLAGVEAIVDQLLQADTGELALRHAGQRRELARVEVLPRPAALKGGPL